MKTIKRLGSPAFTVAMFGLVFFTLCAAVTVEQYESEAAFTKRLGGQSSVYKIGFDDIDASIADWVFFPSDRYLVTHGILIIGQDGQYASRNFTYPDDFVAVSNPNMYAPGPVDTTGQGGFAGGNTTDVTFSNGFTEAVTAGFGLYFIDTDYPGQGPSSATIYDRDGNELATSGTVVTTDGAHKFVGFVTVDNVSNYPVRAIARVHIINGSGWPGNDYNEGSALDDFVFARPAVTPVPNLGEGTIGTEITITGSGFGDKKGKVLIGGLAQSVETWSDASIKVLVKKTPLPAEIAYDVSIQPKPKGTPTFELPGAFVVRNPELNPLVTSHGAPGTSITITGNFFSTQKGKVYLEVPSGKPKSCKVTSWSMDSITFVVPKTSKSFPAGTYPLKVANKVGTTYAPSDFTVD